MTLGQALRFVVVNGLIVIFWVWVDPAIAVVLGIISMGVVNFANLHPKPRWIQKFWPIALSVVDTKGSFLNALPIEIW